MAARPAPALCTSVAHGELSVEQLRGLSASELDARGPGGRTALLLACAAGAGEDDCALFPPRLADGAVQRLVAGGADVNVRDDYGYTALILAVQRGRGVAAVRALVERMRDDGLGARDEECELTALEYACADGARADVAAFLVDTCATRGVLLDMEADHESVLLAALYADHDIVDLVTALLRVGVPGPRSRLQSRETGDTPLLLACKRHIHEASALKLLAHPTVAMAMINTPNKSGFTPLLCACEQGSLVLVKALVERGADVRVATLSAGWTPLHCCVYHGAPEDVVKFLVSAVPGVDVHARDRKGKTALDLARERGHVALARVIEAEVEPQTKVARTDG